LAEAGVERRKQLFDFLNEDLAPGHSAEELKAFLNTDPAFRDSVPPHVIAGVVASDGVSVFPLMKDAGSVEARVDEGLPALWGFIESGNPLVLGGGLGKDYTCKQLVWDPKLKKWVWEYNYTLKELNSTRLGADEISDRFLDMLDASPNPPTPAEWVELRKIKPTYRLACVAVRDESVVP
jgi:hypothetical protein